MPIAPWWTSPDWLAYERACGREGARARQLATASWDTRVVDLRQDQPALWRGVRRSYHALINRLTRDDGFAVVPATPVLLVTDCRRLHRDVAGRETRPAASWVLQGQWLESGHGLAFAAYRARVPVAFVYLLLDGAWAYYSSAAAVEPDANHALLWHAMLALKAAGVEIFEVGWQGEARDEKGRNIEFFRRGWGGVDVAVRDVC